MSGWNYKNSDILASKTWGYAPSLFEGINDVCIYWKLPPLFGPSYV
jgi:hypothetical protein